MVTLTFVALAVPTIRDRSALIAATTAGAVAVVTYPLPFRLGLPVAAGIAAGLAHETWAHSRPPR